MAKKKDVDEAIPVLDPTRIAHLEILNTKEAAVYLRRSVATLSRLRCIGGGPTFMRPSARQALYRRTDLDAWLADRTHQSTSEYATAGR